MNRNRRIDRLVKIRPWVQALSLLLFLGLVLAAGRSAAAAQALSRVLLLDPLLVLLAWLTGGVVGTFGFLALISLLVTLIFGRAWCGWLCPLGTLLDWITPHHPLTLKSSSERQAAKRMEERSHTLDRWRKVKYLLLLVLLALAIPGLFGKHLPANLSLVVIDPLTLVLRTFSISVMPALDRLVTWGELSLSRLPGLNDPLRAFDGVLRPALLPLQPTTHQGALLFALLFAGLVVLNWVVPRFWCRYICPLGGLLGLLSRFSLVRRQVSQDEASHGCAGCGLCARNCPTGTIDPRRAFQSDPAECTLCLDCVQACPRPAVKFAPGGAFFAGAMTYDPGRRQTLLSLGGTVLGLAVLRSEPAKTNPYRLRPPGVWMRDPNDGVFLAACVRCGACINACPTAGLQPSIGETGVEGLWTPVLVPRLGYCDFSCNLCGQACPVGAIPSLGLNEKREQVVGKASIDRERCLAWAEGTPCIVCEEMCPIADKAIHLEDHLFKYPDGHAERLRAPVMLRERCIGCGICEYKCPLNGEAAIRVRLS